MVDIADAARSGRLGNVTIRTRKGGNKTEDVEKISVSRSGRVSSSSRKSNLNFVVGSSSDPKVIARKQRDAEQRTNAKLYKSFKSKYIYGYYAVSSWNSFF